MLKTIGIILWAGCLLTLAWQAVSWVIFASWPTITLMDALAAVTDVDFLSIIHTLSFDLAIKTFYICFTTQLTLFLWWAGVFFFGMSFAKRTIFK